MTKTQLKTKQINCYQLIYHYIKLYNCYQYSVLKIRNFKQINIEFEKITSHATYWSKVGGKSTSWPIQLHNVVINLHRRKINPLFNVGLKQQITSRMEYQAISKKDKPHINITYSITLKNGANQGKLKSRFHTKSSESVNRTTVTLIIRLNKIHKSISLI